MRVSIGPLVALEGSELFLLVMQIGNWCICLFVVLFVVIYLISLCLLQMLNGVSKNASSLGNVVVLPLAY